MNENELKRNENLCNKLDMNFEEANELFGKDTLNSMQMVRVNGGIEPVTTIIVTCAIIGAIAAGIEIYKFAKEMIDSSGGSSGGSTDDPGDVEIKQTTEGVKAKQIKNGWEITGDSAKVFDQTGAHIMTIYYTAPHLLDQF